MVFRSRKCFEKILFWSGPLFGKIFGSELLFLWTCNRAVTHSWLLLHAFPPSRRGKCCPFFSFLFFVSGSASFVVILPFFFSEGRCLKKFSGANFCFWVSVLVLCVLVLFCLCFCFSFGILVPEPVLKNSLDVRSGVFGLSSVFLCLFRRRRRFFPFLFF